MLYKMHEDCPGKVCMPVTPEDLAADPAVQALIAAAEQRGREEEREAAVVWLRKAAEALASMGEDTYAADYLDLASDIESGAHHPTETDHG